MSEQQKIQEPGIEVPTYRTPIKQLIRQIVVLILTIAISLLTTYANIMITTLNERFNNLNENILKNYTKIN